jgi:hypothetical protein
VKQEIKEGTFIWAIWHKVVVVNSWKVRLIKGDVGKHLIGIIEFLERRFSPPLAKPLGFGCYSETLHCGSLGLRGMILPSTTISGGRRNFKGPFGKASLVS